MKIDKKIIKELSDYLDEFNLTELEYTEKDTKIKVSKNNISVNNQSHSLSNNQVQKSDTNKTIDKIKTGIEVKSPIIGTFYRKPSPDKPMFVEVGQQINEGDVLCVIEAMKLFNEIESEVSGKIVKVLAEDQSPIEFDQPLFLVDPS